MLLPFRTLIGIGSHSKKAPLVTPPGAEGTLLPEPSPPRPPGPRKECFHQGVGPQLIWKVHLALIPACPHLSPSGILLLYLATHNFKGYIFF